jgi:ABC-type Fe3+ transport system permease subunit
MIRSVFAAEDLSTIYKPGGALGGSSATLGKFLAPLIQNTIVLTALASFIAIILAGFNLISSQGDKAKVQQATNMLNYALVGLVLAVAAFVITQIVGRVGGFDFLNPGI